MQLSFGFFCHNNLNIYGLRKAYCPYRTHKHIHSENNELKLLIFILERAFSVFLWFTKVWRIEISAYNTVHVIINAKVWITIVVILLSH